jgi:hypothetical protein
VSGNCLELDEPNLPFVALYGGLGLAAVAVAVVWFALSGDDADPQALPITATPNGLSLRTTF